VSRRAKFNTPRDQARRFKEGRGQGEGSAFVRWLDVKDVPSQGRRHRIYGVKFDYTMHLMSDLERNAYYLAEFLAYVESIKDQFPLLPLSETQEIARELRIKRHPRFGRYDLVMTTDQVWTVSTPSGPMLQPLSCKYLETAEEPRMKEINAIETAYWQRRTPLPLKDFNETSVSRTFIRNWGLIRGTLRKGYFLNFPAKIVERVSECIRADAVGGVATQKELVALAASRLGIGPAEVLSAIYYLIASRTWTVDLDKHLLAPTQSFVFLPKAVA
jgi:hypothetical protein